MKYGKLWIALLLVSGGVMFASLYLYQKGEKSKAAANARPAADANIQAAARGEGSSPARVLPSASAPAAGGEGAPHSASSSSPPASSSAPARAFRPRWRQEAQGPAQEIALGSLAPESNFGFRLELTTEGAAVQTLKLTGYYASVQDKKLAARTAGDRAAFERGLAADPARYGGNYSLLNPVRVLEVGFRDAGEFESLGYLDRGDGVCVWGGKLRNSADQGAYIQAVYFDPAKWSAQAAADWIAQRGYRDRTVAYRRFLPLATRRIEVWLPGSAEPLAWRLDDRQWQLLDQGPAVHPDGSRAVRFAWRLFQDANFADEAGPPRPEPFLTVIKTYTVRPGSYSVDVSLEVANESNLPLKVALTQYGPLGVPTEGPPPDSRQVVIGKVKDGDPYVLFKPRDHLKNLAPGQTEIVGYSQEEPPRRTLWLGETNQFFGSMMYPRPADANALGDPAVPIQFAVAGAMESPESRTFLPIVTLGRTRDPQDRPVDAPLALAPGGKVRLDLDVFAGPKKRDVFADPSAPFYNGTYKDLRYIDTIQFGTCCSFSWLSLAMMWLLQALSTVSLGNYGVAIILLVILVRVALHPLTKKGQVTMSKLQKMQPAMEALRAKYADDKQALQREMMKLFPEQGRIMLLGCLPTALQMPIWAALYSALSAAAELRHAAFLPVWLTDLASPDVAFHVPYFGWPVHLLPILGCVSTIIQMKLTPQGAPATTPEQRQQQAIMKYMMPAMMIFIFYRMPSGLNLYIMVSGVLAAAESWVIREHIKKREALAAATTTVVAVPGRGPRGSRPKKPKGPFWTKHS